MEITLKLKDENGNETNKKFKSVKLTGRAVMKAMKLQDNMKNKDKNSFNSNDLEELVEFVPLAFGDKFTEDEFIDGIGADDLIPVCVEVQEIIAEQSTKKMNNIAKN